MKDKKPEVFLEHILESINLIIEYTENKNLDDFLKFDILQDAVIRRFEIMGEAVKNLPKDLRKEHDHIPWREIAGMRDILIHKYFGVELKTTWKVIDNRLPGI